MATEAPAPQEPTPRRSPLSVGDLVGLLIASIFGVLTLVLPFGRDQGLYFYVGREWVRHGRIPYRDVFDHKTPGIYYLHALAIRVFGEHQWGIRIFDFVAVVATGLVVAWLSAPRDERPEEGAFGRATALVAISFYGVLNFWDTAQSELHYALLGCLAVLFARRFDGNKKHFPLLSGIAMGAALVMKPPAICLCLFAAGIMALRLREQKAKGKDYAAMLGLTAVGASAPIGLTLGYFASKGALAAMKDIVVGANGYYVSHERDDNPFADTLDAAQGYFAHMTPLSLLIVVAAIVFVLAKKAGDEDRVARYKFAFSLLAASYLCVAMQMKYYLLHWIPLVAPLSLLGLLLARDLTKLLEDRGYSVRRAKIAPWALLLGIYFLGPHGRRWAEQQIAVGRYARGIDSRERYLARYSVWSMNFNYADSSWVGDWLREHTTEDEPVLVRGFQPEVYAIAKRSYPGRFFWTTFLVSKARAYRRPEYLAEDLGAFESAKPRFVVARSDCEANTVDDASYYLPRGYHRVLEHGHFVILERNP